MPADRGFCTVILNKREYVNKVNAMTDEVISKTKYVETVDSTHEDLKHFQDFLYRHFYKTIYYDGMHPISNQHARLPIIDQTGIYIYDASKVVAEFLKRLARNEFTISDTLAFPELLKIIENSDGYKDVSYGLESLFTSIPIKKNIGYIIHKIYTENVIEPMCKKPISKKIVNKTNERM